MKKRKSVKIFLLIIILLAVILGIWVSKPENFKKLKSEISDFLSGGKIEPSYNAKSLVLVDLSNDENFIYKQVNEQQIPASLSKLFVIEYANTLIDLDDVVHANYSAISLTKTGSSVANIKETDYYVKNLYAAMLVPSGNDAAYVLADYCGSIISPNTKSSKERIEIFMENLNKYLKEQDYKDTKLYDPSGFDTEARTTVLDLKKVVKKLIEKYKYFS